MSLANFQRQIAISSVLNADGTTNQTLKQIVVTISYTTGTSTVPRTYTVNALISSFR
jgi:carbonic anhydrase